MFIDWSQNNGNKTTVSPYSLRGRSHPSVAAPRTWDELDDPGLRQLEYHEVVARIEELGDPMAALGIPARELRVEEIADVMCGRRIDAGGAAHGARVALTFGGGLAGIWRCDGRHLVCESNFPQAIEGVR